MSGGLQPLESVPLTARGWLSAFVDPGSFRELGSLARARDPLGFHDQVAYPERLARATAATGESEAVVVGLATLHGRRIAVGAFEFGFLGGSLGVATADRLVRLFERARVHDLPVVIRHCSGGARMQEGTFALFQMGRLAAAVRRFRRGRAPFLSILGDPTTGGVWASVAGLGDLLIGEPGGRIAFAGRRVVEGTLRAPVETPPRAEELLEAGLLDAVIPTDAQRDRVAAILALLQPEDAPRPTRCADDPVPAGAPTGAQRYERLRRARQLSRRSFAVCLEHLLDEFVELGGDRSGTDDGAIRGGLARLGSHPLVVVGIDRGSSPSEAKRRRFGMPRPCGFRKAWRLWQLAERLRLPVLNLVDTPGACPSLSSEAEGQALAIAQSLDRLQGLAVPVIGLVVGEGGSGGALALLVGDHLAMLENASLSVISPEGCAAILWRRREAAAQAAEAMRSTAWDLRASGLVDAVIPEPAGGLQADPVRAAGWIRSHLRAQLERLEALAPAERLRRRERRWIATRYTLG